MTLRSNGLPGLVIPADRLGERHRAALAELATFDVLDRLCEIRVPTLVVCGRIDPLIPLSQCELLGQIPNAEVAVRVVGHDVGPGQEVWLRSRVERFLAERLRVSYFGPLRSLGKPMDICIDEGAMLAAMDRVHT